MNKYGLEVKKGNNKKKEISNLDNKDIWGSLRIKGYILLMILTISRMYFVLENKIIFSFLLIMYGISLFTNKCYIVYIFSVIVGCFSLIYFVKKMNYYSFIFGKFLYYLFLLRIL